MYTINKSHGGEDKRVHIRGPLIYDPLLQLLQLLASLFLTFVVSIIAHKKKSRFLGRLFPSPLRIFYADYRGSYFPRGGMEKFRNIPIEFPSRKLERSVISEKGSEKPLENVFHAGLSALSPTILNIYRPANTFEGKKIWRGERMSGLLEKGRGCAFDFGRRESWGK